MRAGRKRKPGHRHPSGQLKRVKRSSPDKGAVYIIELSYGIVKIGYSNDPIARLEDLQVGTDRRLLLICYFWMRKEHARGVERAVHEKLRGGKFHARGEIYYMDAATAVDLVKTIAADKVIDMVGSGMEGPYNLTDPERLAYSNPNWLASVHTRRWLRQRN